MADSGAVARDVRTAAGDLYEAAAAASIPLRLIGSLAVEESCPAHRHLLPELGRRPPRDIDLVIYSRDERRAQRLFQERGYLADPMIAQSREFGVKRLIYHDPGGRFKVDVFLDQLVMAHTVDLRHRLELAAPTVTLVDLVLSKVQIHAITDNDLIDLAVLLAEHEAGPGQAIDLDHLVNIMARDWGFYRTTADNLHLLRQTLDRFSALPAASAAAARDRIATLQQAIEAVRKSAGWRLRARIGRRIRWYEEVDEVDRHSG